MSEDRLRSTDGEREQWSEGGETVGAEPKRNAAAEPLTEADATALSKLERDGQAGNDGERAGAILVRPPRQITPAGPDGEEILAQ